MAQANIYWLQENYAAVEKIFRKSVEFCNDNEIWKLNVRNKTNRNFSYLYFELLGCSCSFYAR